MKISGSFDVRSNFKQNLLRPRRDPSQAILPGNLSTYNTINSVYYDKVPKRNIFGNNRSRSSNSLDSCNEMYTISDKSQMPLQIKKNTDQELEVLQNEEKENFGTKKKQKRMKSASATHS